jgi:hypothetical protein
MNAMTRELFKLLWFCLVVVAPDPDPEEEWGHFVEFE